jgi:mutual gliding-motility protein MglA
MAVINYLKKEISAKIVYYGPSLCGKTTNIQSIYTGIKPEQKGKLVSLATEADRTLFFDFLPIEIANVRGFKTRLHFYTVPGQVYYNSTRRAVLTGVDGLVFVADSQRDKMEENIESLNNLEENLNYYGKSIKTLPLVIQYNKRDLQDIMSIAESNQILNPDGYPSTEAIATSGEGVLETLTLITKMVLQHIEKGASPQQQKIQAGFQTARPEVSEPVKVTQEAAPEKAEKAESLAASAGKTIPEDLTDQAPGEKIAPVIAFSGGRIRIISTGTPGIISANAFSLPIKLKFENDDKIYTMEIAIKLDKIIPEG